MRKSLFVFSLISAVLFLSSCTPKHGEILLAKYDKGNVTIGEFEKAYSKNSGGLEAAKDDSLEQYQKFFQLVYDIESFLDVVLRYHIE